MEIRPSRPSDDAAILTVVGTAFSDPTRDAGEELDIVRRTWAARPDRTVLELVADDGGDVVAHLQAAPGRVDGIESAVAGVAPVCVAPAAQGHGVGSALMRALLGAGRDAGWPLLVLLGNPAYYSRFGFEPAQRHGLHYAPVGTDNPHFQARPLHDVTGADATRWRGAFSYCWEP
ncbi:MAG TPA: N-acetyltransferase [Acidimicrobiales bacterium]|nr:N-acetyltransferase [Acidimicrobiales bacterium]